MWNLLSIRNRLRAFVLRVVETYMQRRFQSGAAAASEVSRLRHEIMTLSHAAARDRDALNARIEKLELVLTEHPHVATRDASASPFPSPAVSIIMPTWNRARIVAAAIRSVQLQEFSDWELIVVDDGSEDDTADVVASFGADPRVRYVPRPHAGQCVARNFGQGIAKGSLIAYLDSDNLWYPEFLATAVNLFIYRTDIDSAYGAMVTETHGSRVLFEPFDRERLLTGNFIDMSTFIHRRGLIDRFGGFDPDASPMEDWDLILRYTAHSPPYRLPVLAVRYREVDHIRVSDTQEKLRPTRTIQSKWAPSP